MAQTPHKAKRTSGQSKPAGRKSSASRQASRQKQSNPSPSVIDERTRRDIGGILCLVLAVALFVAAIQPTDGIVSGAIAEGLHTVFGIGAYIVPLFLAAIGITFLVRFDRERVPARVAIGLAVILIAVLGLIALASPIQNGDYDQLFLRQLLIAYGGYIGAGIAWCGYVLFGPIITGIILVGLIVVGVTVIGFSLSSLIETIQTKRQERTLRLESRGTEKISKGGPFAKIRKKGTGENDLDDNYALDAYGDVIPAAEATMALGANSPSGRRGTLNEQSARSSRRMKEASEDTGNLEAADTAYLTPMEKPRRRRVSKETPASKTSVVVEETIPAPMPATRHEAELGDEGPSTLTRKLGVKNAPAEKPQKAPRKKATPKPTPTSANDNKDGYQLPSEALLVRGDGRTAGASDAELQQTGAELQETLEDFGIMAVVKGWVAGPTVTLFKIELPPGVRVSRVTALNDDIALALAAPGVRIFAPVPGTNYVGIEVPNRERKTVFLTDLLHDLDDSPLSIAIGKDVEGNSITGDLSKMPHLLIAGTTGSGKSVEVNGMIMSILMRATPDEVRFIMIDPKRVEFSGYNGIPHLYVPVVTECKEAASALSWGVAEMERRLKLFSKVGARNIVTFNKKAEEAEKADQEARDRGETPEPNEFGGKLPYIVIVIDELADLMMNVGKEVEFSISRIAQLARAAGIHLIIATQRPSTNIVTGLIKANITCRIGLTVASGIDSRVILDSTGAENLIGQGDLLISKPEYAKPLRVQGPFVSDDEINSVVEHWKAQGEPEYHSEILQTNVITLGASSPDGSGGGAGDDDPLIWEAADIVVSSGLGSTSNVQRRLKVGYARAGRIMDQLEEKGVVGPANGSKPREVLMDAMELETIKAFEANDE